MSSNTPPSGPPYRSPVAQYGETPITIPDVPICAVLIAIYLGFGVLNLVLFNLRRAHGYFFLPQALIGGFCMARVLTLALRIGWTEFPDDIPLSIAAGIFVNVGIIIVYVLNVLFAQRILRARQPQLGWHRLLTHAVFTTAYCLIGISLVLLITLIVVSDYTLNPSVLSAAEWIEKSALLVLLITTLLPIVVLAFAFGLPRAERMEHFGLGHNTMPSNAIILAIGSSLCVLVQGFKVGVLWSPARPASNPAWYDSKASFYCFLFVPEILIVTLYTVLRFYERFHVPNGSSKRRTYDVPSYDEDGARVGGNTLQDEEKHSEPQDSA